MATSLPHLEDVERLSPRVIRILGGNPSKFTLQGTNTYLLGTGPSRLLIDSAQGLPAWKTSLAQTLRSENCTISGLLLTHWHPDHVGGISDFQTLCPEAKIYKSQIVPSTGPSADSQFDIIDGQNFSVEGVKLKALHTPGHTKDHMALILEEEGAMFTGDNVLGHGTAVFEDLATYLSSLQRMKAAIPTTGAADDSGLRPGRAYPGHGAVIEDGTKKIEEYVSHRREREEQILAAMRQGGGEGMGSMQIVKVVYKGYPESLHQPAEGGVVQVLRKLEGEARVREESGGKWVLVEQGRAAL